MNARVKAILSQVRLRLSETSKANLQNDEVIYTANYVQNQILMRTKCVEKTFTLTMAAGTESYSFAAENSLHIFSIIPSWEGGEIKLLPASVWKSYQDLSGDHPQYATIFNNSLYVSPIPGTGTTDTITIWAYQTAAETPISSDDAPEIPEYADYCLILGVCAEYNPERYLPQFESQLALISKTAHRNKATAAQSLQVW